jgi:hypothetical protein
MQAVGRRAGQRNYDDNKDNDDSLGRRAACGRAYLSAGGMILSTAGFLLPTSKLDVKPLLYLPSNPHAPPFDISFNPDPTSPPQANHACPHTTIGFDITISSLAPCPSFDPTSSDVTNILSANANSHLQKQERKKLGRNNKKNRTTGTSTIGDKVIGNILTKNMILIPLAIDPFRRFGPILQHFLFDTPPTTPITFTNAKPNATLM